MKTFSKIFSFFLFFILSINLSAGFFSQENISKALPIIGTASLSGLCGYYFYMKNNQNNTKNRQPKIFPLEKLPLDMQNQIAQYLPFNSETDEELISVLNKPSRKKGKSLHGDIIEGNDYSVKVYDDEVYRISKSSKENKLKIAFQEDHRIKLAEVSPNFQTLILCWNKKMFYSDYNSRSIIEIYALKENYWNNKFRYNIKGYKTKKIYQIAITDDGKNIAYSDDTGTHWVDMSKIRDHTIKESDETLLTNNPNIVRLEFNKQGTKLGIKDKNNKIEIIPLAGKKEKENTLQEWFYQKGISKNLKHFSSTKGFKALLSLLTFKELNKYPTRPEINSLMHVSLGVSDFSFMKNCRNYSPLEKLPKDTQNEIAQYLKFKKFESDDDLINVLRKPIKTNANTGNISFENKNFEIYILKNQKEVNCFSKKNNEIYTIFHDPWCSNEIKLAAVSPNFKILILFADEGLIVINELKGNFFDERRNYCNSKSDQISSRIEHIAVDDEGTLAYSNYKGIHLHWYDIQDKERLLKAANTATLKRFVKKSEIASKKITNNQLKIKYFDGSTETFPAVERLEFNKQGTKLGIKYKDGNIEIIPIPGREKKDPQKTLQQYFYENIIKKDLKHYTPETKTSLDELD